MYTTPDQIFGWSLTTGRYRPLGKPPNLGEAQNDLEDGGGFVRVEAATAARVVIARGEGSALYPGVDKGSGHRVRVGPLRGPFGDPAGCGERPADLDGDLLAYLAAPARRPRCPPGRVPAVRGPAIVVRDLAAGNAVVLTRPVPFDGAVRQLEVRGNFLAYSLATGPDDEEGNGKPDAVEVIDLRSGSTLLSLAPSRARAWTLLNDGSIVSGAVGFSRRGGRCLGSLKSFRR